MKKILFAIIAILMLAGCGNTTMSFEKCLLSYEEGKVSCTQDELTRSMIEIINESSLLDEEEYWIESITMLSDDVVYINGSSNNEISKDEIETWQLVLEFIDNEMLEKDFMFEILLGNDPNIIIAQDETKYIAILVVNHISISLSEKQISELDYFIESSGFTDKRIRYGNILTGDDINVGNDVFIVKESDLPELQYFVDELERVFSSYTIVVE